MNRTHSSERRVLRPRLKLRRAPALPQPVYREFVDMLFSMRLPVVGLGLVFVLVAALVAREWQDGAMAALAVSGVIVTVLRFFHMRAYHRAARTAELSDLRRWEWGYGAGVAAFALLVGLLNICAFRYDEPLIQLLSVSLYFAFGAGLVSRISIRPVICGAGVVMATVPTVSAVIMQQAVSGTARLHAELYALEGLLIAMIAALSLQSMSHLYRKAVSHHTSEHDMAGLAKHDALTGLANRLMLRERFQAASEDAGRGVKPLAVHFLDLDGFKPVNDTNGHLVGDAVLKEVARRLEAAVRTSDTVARLGGDEFVVLQVGVEEASEAELLARRIVKRLSAPYRIGDATVTISVSIGIALNAGLPSDIDLLLSCADRALYRSKAGGKNRLNFCSAGEVSNILRAA